MSTSQKVSGLWTMTKGEFEESVKQLEAAMVKCGGNPCQIFDRFRVDANYALRIAELMLRDGFEVSTEIKLARLILGRNIFTDADWMSYYGATFVKKQRREAGKFPWSEEVLNAPCPFVKGKLVKDTHFAFLGVPNLKDKALTVLGWHELHPASGQPRFYFSENLWYGSQPYATETTCEARWYLLLRDIVPDSVDKTPEEQEAMRPPEYELSTTIAEVTKDMLVFRKTDVRPNPTRWARCKEKTVKTAQAPDGNLSCVGHFDGNGLKVNGWDGYRLGVIGASAARKPN